VCSFRFLQNSKIFQNSKISRDLEDTMRDMKDRLSSLSSTYVWKKLMPFQKQGVEFSLLKSKGRTLFGDQMGLGKTIQAITSAYVFVVHSRNFHSHSHTKFVFVVHSRNFHPHTQKSTGTHSRMNFHFS
jgi:SNF2 family DNA or RNA helicase